MLYNHPSKHKSNTTTDGIFFQKKKCEVGKSQSQGANNLERNTVEYFEDWKFSDKKKLQ